MVVLFGNPRSDIAYNKERLVYSKCLITFKSSLWLLYCLVTCLLYYLYWRTCPYLPLICFASGSAAVGISLQKYRNRSKLRGALIGAVFGAVLSLIVEFALLYLLLENFEDEGLGYIRSVLVFAPLVSLIGLLSGFFVWVAERYLLRVEL